MKIFGTLLNHHPDVLGATGDEVVRSHFAKRGVSSLESVCNGRPRPGMLEYSNIFSQKLCLQPGMGTVNPYHSFCGLTQTVIRGSGTTVSMVEFDPKK